MEQPCSRIGVASVRKKPWFDKLTTRVTQITIETIIPDGLDGCATSLGEDTGGSIRRPAAWCGLAGLRPSWSRVSRYGVAPGSWSMDQVGPISRTVEDAAITLGAIAGYDPKDRYSRDLPVPDYRRGLRKGVRGLRIGAIKKLIHSEIVDSEVRDAVIKAGSSLGAT